MLTNRVFAHKSPGTPFLTAADLPRLISAPLFRYNMPNAVEMSEVKENFEKDSRNDGMAVRLGRLVGW